MSKRPSDSEKPVGLLDAKQQSVEVCNFARKHSNVADYLVAILQDCHELIPSYGRDEFARDKETIIRRYTHEGLSFATKTLPAFFDSLLTYLETGKSAYPSFKLNRGCAYPVFLRKLTAPLYECPNDATVNLKVLYQLCVSFKKLKGPYKNSVILNHLKDFVDVDTSLPTFEHVESFKCDDGEVVDEATIEKLLFQASVYITNLLGDLDPFDQNQSAHFLPRPGPGATNTPTKRCDRYRPAVRYEQLAEVFDFDEWYCCPSPLHPQVSYFDLRSRKTYKTSGETTSDVPTSRYKCVPKTFSKPRGICIEQLEVQYFQQGLRNALYERSESSNPVVQTTGFVNFTDQSKNGRLALYSSINGDYATIDMSSASDRISRGLVQRLFSGCPSLLKAMMACSTRVISLPVPIAEKQQLECKKFAPMGSALCFPVMGLVHWALLKAVFAFAMRTRDLIPIWVYGDDIIVPSHLAPLVYKYLPVFGMKLNTEKSFFRSRFRESCGINAFNGVDITPTRFKTLVKNPFQMSDLISMLRNEYELHKKGFANTARHIRSEIRKVCNGWVVKQLPTVSPKSQVLGWIRDDCDAPRYRYLTGKRRRWNSHSQVYEQSAMVVLKRTVDPPLLNESEGYLRYLINPIHSDNLFDEEKQNGRDDHIRRRECGEAPTDFTVVWRQVPDSAF